MEYAINLNDLMCLRGHVLVDMIITPLLTDQVVKVIGSSLDDQALVLNSNKEDKDLDALFQVLFRKSPGRFKGFRRKELRFYKNIDGNWSLVDNL